MAPGRTISSPGPDPVLLHIAARLGELPACASGDRVVLTPDGRGAQVVDSAQAVELFEGVAIRVLDAASLPERGQVAKPG